MPAARSSSRRVRTAPRRLAPLIAPLAGTLVVLGLLGEARARPADVAEVRRLPWGESEDVDIRIHAPEAEEIAVSFEAHGGPLVVAQAHEGGWVSEGDSLIRFEHEDFAAEHEKRRLALETARIALERKHQDVQREEEQARLERQSLRVRLDRAVDDLLWFREVGRPLRIAEAEYAIEGLELRLRQQKEELAQLLAMYEEDELVEATEEIVIRRARDAIERTAQSLAFRKTRHKRFLGTTLPREEYDKTLAKDNAERALAHFEARAALDGETRQLGLEEAKRAHAERERDFAKFEADAEQLMLRAPFDGYALPGRISGGKWEGREAAAARLAVGEQSKPGTVYYTLIPAHGAEAVGEVSPELFAKLAIGRGVALSLPALPGQKIYGVLSRLESVPSGDKHRFVVSGLVPTPGLWPGMTGKAHLLLEGPLHAVAVPEAAIRSEGGGAVVETVTDEGVRLVPVVPGAVRAGWVSIEGSLRPGTRVTLRPTGAAATGPR